MSANRPISVLDHLESSGRTAAMTDLARNHKIVPYRSKNGRPANDTVALWRTYAQLAGINGESLTSDFWMPVGNIGPLLIIGHHLTDWKSGQPLPRQGDFPSWAVARVVIPRSYHESILALLKASPKAGGDTMDPPTAEPFTRVPTLPQFNDEYEALAFAGRHFPMNVHDRSAVEKFIRRGGSGALPPAASLPEGYRELAITLHRHGAAAVDLRDCLFLPDVTSKVPDALAARFTTAAFADASGLLFVAAPDPDNLEFCDNLLNRMSLADRPDIVVALCSESRCQHALGERGGSSSSAAQPTNDGELSSMEVDHSLHNASAVEVNIDPEKAEWIDHRDRDITPTQLFHCILYNAVRQGASDIHFEYFADGGQVRFRVDGVLRIFCRPPLDVYLGVIAIVKNEAALAASNFQGSDGRFSFRCDPHHCDVRVNGMPWRRDRLKVTCRLLDKGRNFRRLGDLRIEADRMAMIERVLQAPQGMILVTGPTGSGKSTTIYAMLAHINRADMNIQTVEDPIEYEIDGLNQTMINKDRGITYDVVLPLLMRTDPDVIFIGEIRDEGMAKLACEASQTGHLVLSTLHTTSTTETIHRLAEMHIPPYILGQTLNLITANRLVQTLCEDCAERHPYTPEMLEIFKNSRVEPPSTFYRSSRGCKKCGETGYRGQMALMEFCPIDQDFKDVISTNPNPKALRDLFKEKGYFTLYQEGLRRVAAGHTDFNAIVSVADAWENIVRQPANA